MGSYKTVNVDVEVDLDYFDDDDIKEEYESRFGPHAGEWLHIYEKRRSLSRENFLAWIDIIIQNKTGRIL